VYQHGKYSLFVGRVVVGVRIEIEGTVCGFNVNNVVQ
jgi:hypothetical protein